MHCVKRKAVKCLHILTNLSSSGRSLWYLSGDMCWPKEVSYRPMYTVLSPTNLKYVHEMIVERLETYTISLESSERSKIMVSGAKFGWFDLELGLFMKLAIFRVTFRVIYHILCYNRLIDNYYVLWIVKIGPPEATVHKNVCLWIQCHSDTRLTHFLRINIWLLTWLTNTNIVCIYT